MEHPLALAPIHLQATLTQLCRVAQYRGLYIIDTSGTM